jgi:hypothetical protein
MLRVPLKVRIRGIDFEIPPNGYCAKKKIGVRALDTASATDVETAGGVFVISRFDGQIQKRLQVITKPLVLPEIANS